MCWGYNRTSTHESLPSGAHSLPPNEFTCLRNTTGNSNWNFIAGKSLRDLFIPALILKNHSHLPLNMIYVPGTVLSTLHALSTYSSPQPYKGGTSTLILALKKWRNWGWRKLNDLLAAPQLTLEELDLPRSGLTPQPVGLNHCVDCLGGSAIKPWACSSSIPLSKS